MPVGQRVAPLPPKSLKWIGSPPRGRRKKEEEDEETGSSLVRVFKVRPIT